MLEDTARIKNWSLSGWDMGEKAEKQGLRESDTEEMWPIHFLETPRCLGTGNANKVRKIDVLEYMK